MSGLHAARKQVRTLVVLTAIACVMAVPTGAGASGSRPVHATLTSAERAFAKVFKADMANFAHAVDPAFAPLGKLSGKSTVTQIVTAVTGASKAWNSAMKPVLALKAPAQVSRLVAQFQGYMRAANTDLLGMEKGARTGNENAYLQSGQHLQTDAEQITAEEAVLAKTLGISLAAIGF